MKVLCDILILDKFRLVSRRVVRAKQKGWCDMCLYSARSGTIYTSFATCDHVFGRSKPCRRMHGMMNLCCSRIDRYTCRTVLFCFSLKFQHRELLGTMRYAALLSAFVFGTTALVISTSEKDDKGDRLLQRGEFSLSLFYEYQ